MNKIAEMRRERRLNQKELGAILGVAQNTICNWEKGKREPDHESLKKMAYFFNCSIDDLLGDILDATSNEKVNFSSGMVDCLQADRQKGKTAPPEEGGSALDARLIERLMQLTPEEREKVEAFVQGMIAGRGTNES